MGSEARKWDTISIYLQLGFSFASVQTMQSERSEYFALTLPLYFCLQLFCEQLAHFSNTPILFWEVPVIHQINLMSNSQSSLSQFYI